MTLRTPVFPRGTRVELQRGRFPFDASLIGRVGTVVEVSDYRPERYGIVLDGEERVRDLHESELTAPGD